MASAPSFTTDRIRNVVVVGHGGSGKSTLVDACCFVAGTTRRHGVTTDGSALTMFAPEEIKHGVSINVSLAYAEHQETKINFIDTPGYLDFAGDTRAGIRVADGAVVVVSAVNGVEVGTERVWEWLQERHLPAIIFVSMMDRQNADFEQVYRDIKEHVTPRAIPVEVPIGSGEGFKGIVNLFHDRVHFYHETESGAQTEEAEVPAEMKDTVERYYQEMIETIAATDDALLEHYLEGDSIGRDEAVHALKQAMLRGDLYPVFVGAPNLAWGAQALLNEIVELMPSPQERPTETAQGRAGEVELRNLNSDPFAALVFKTTSEPHVGELSYFRVFGGSLKNGAEVINATRDKPEKLAHLSIALGKERVEVEELRAGDIGVVAKLKDTHTNDTLAAPSFPLTLPGVEFPEPDIAVSIASANRGDEDKLGTGLAKLHEEDPTFRAEYDPELGQTIARGCGELHLDVQIERLRRKANVEVVVGQPRIAYREAIRAQAEAQGRHKKQTGGRGQFGDAHVRLKPLPRGSGYRFTDAIVGGVIPGKYVPAVDKGIQEAAARGILAGYPVVDFEAECFFGSYHSVDSSEMAFKMAGILAFNTAAEKARPTILEPILQVEVVTPEEFMGDVIGDLNQRRGRILGMDSAGRNQKVTALVPQAELYKYATTLRSLTQGRAMHTRKFASYEEVPEAEQQKLIAEAKKHREEMINAR